MKKIWLFLILVVLFSSSALATTRSRAVSGAIVIDSLKYEPYPVESGSYFNIWIKVENYGALDTNNAMFILEPSFPFSIDEEDAERTIGSLGPGEEAVLEYRVMIDDGAIEGYNELDFKFSSDGKAWITHTFDIFVRTQDVMLNTQEVSVTPEEVAPGEIATVDILLKNMADSTIKDLRAELQLTQRDVLATSVEYSELPFTPIDSTNVLMTQRLGPKEQKLFTFNLRVDPDTTPKVYRIPLVLTYSDEIGNTTYTEEGIIAVVVAKSPDLMISLDDSEIFTKNSMGEVTIGVYNIGMSKIKFAVLEILESDSYEILSTPTLYLGNVDSDDYETADFNLYIKDNNPNINLVLNYKDEYNEEHQDELSLSLKTYSSKDAKKYGFIKSSAGGIVFLIVLILGIGTWIYFKKYKKKGKKK